MIIQVAHHQTLIIIIKYYYKFFITNNIIYLTYIMSKIFVSIACFMDKDIINTINDCMKNAVKPDNLVFGICLQYDPDDDFLKMYDNNPQFKIIKMHWKEAKGPAYARGLIYELFSNENYFFQLDCHTRFFSNWDINLINCLSECKKLNKKSIISHYPININNMNDSSSLKHIANISTVRCIDSQLGIKTHGRFIDINNTPKESWGISAAMLFFDRQAYIDVPFDKEIYHGLQFEEQVVLAARYWTHGYNIYTPTKHIIATEYITNSSRFKERPQINQDSKKTTFQRLTHLLKLDYNPTYDQDNYLGNERTIQDYYKLLGIFDKVKDIFPNHYLNQEQYLNKQVFQEIKIGSVGNGYHFSTDYSLNSIVINLDNEKQKMEEMKRKLNLFGISHSRFSGIIGTEIYDSFKNENRFLNNGYNLRPHQIGCWQSHYKIWQKIVDESIPELLILEDDCSFVNDFGSYYNELLTFKKNKPYDILFLGHSGNSVINDKQLTFMNSGCPRCTHAYILTLSGAQKLLKKLNIIDYPIDETIGRMFNNKELNGYCTSFSLCYKQWFIWPKFIDKYYPSNLRSLIINYKSINFKNMSKYFINLDRRIDRKNILMNYKHQYDILCNLQRFNAYDGKSFQKLNMLPFNCVLSNNQKEHILNNHSVSGGILSYGGLGCALSHRALLDIIIKNKYENTLIFEDDIIITSNFSEKLSALKIPADYDLFFLGYHSAHNVKSFDENINKCHRIYGLYGLIISLKGAKKLVEEFKIFNPLQYALDTAYYYNIDPDKINKYCLKPEKQLVYHMKQNSHSNPSDIII